MINNSLKGLLNYIIRYAAEGNEIIAKTHIITLSVSLTGPFASWSVTYKKRKVRFIGETGNADDVFYSIISFINDVDKEINDADNS